MSVKTKRAKCFSPDEIEALVSGVSQHREQVFGAYSQSVTTQTKRAAWRDISNKVNSVNITGSIRTDSQIEHKWYDMKSNAKKRVSLYRKDLKKTGGGTITAKPPTEMDYRIIALMGNESVEGIPGAAAIENWLCHAETSSLSMQISQVNSGDTYEGSSSPIIASSQPFAFAEHEDQGTGGALPYTSYIESETSCHDHSASSTVSSKRSKRKRRRCDDEASDIVTIQREIKELLHSLVDSHKKMEKSLAKIAEKYCDSKL
ncbi:uncharacterized protein LOC120348552 [Styela clava]